MAEQTPSAGPLVAIRGVWKHYAGSCALADVDLDLRAGETVGLVGKNGAGKSTVIKVLAGAVKPDTGAVFIDGREVQLRAPRDAADNGLAFVHQDLSVGLVPNLSVAENVGLGLGYPKTLGALYDAKEQAKKGRGGSRTPRVCSSTSGLRSAQLTVVQQRLVTIAARPQPEPPPDRARRAHDRAHPGRDRPPLRGHLTGYTTRGVAVVYVSHRLPEVFRLAQRVVVMRDGRVVGDGPVGELDGRA